MKNIAFVTLLILSICTCKKNDSTTNNAPTVGASFFARGVDISWLSQMVSQGIRFYNGTGVPGGLYAFLKGQGINSIRLRAWVNPADNYKNTTNVVAKAVRAKNAGMKIRVDLHYIDTWADPGNQAKLLAWATQDITALQVSVHDYTASGMNALKTNGIEPDWVQVGNETNDGMLWPEGKAWQIWQILHH